jgi:hypothetical protein
MKTIRITLIILATLLFAWILPWLMQLATDKPNSYPFAYYSSIINDFGIREYNEKKSILTDSKGNLYTENEFDSIVPMMHFRQLAKDGRLPDSLHGREISQRILSAHSFFFRYRPSDRFRPKIKLYPMLESMPKRVDLEMPGDVFRLGHKIEFIDAETKQVNEEKSLQFDQALKKRGFQGPAKLVAGSPTTRKAYDEGYFIIDNNNQLFHLKRVNGKPFAAQVKLNEGIVPEWIQTTEYPTKAFYGFMLSKAGKWYIIATNGYELKEVPTPEFNPKTDNLLIMADLFNWNVQVTSEAGLETWALDAESLAPVDTIHFENTQKPNPIAVWIFPFQINMKSKNHAWIVPNLKFNGLQYLMVSIILAAGYFIFYNRKRKNKPVQSLWIVATGIFGLFSILLIEK